MSPYEVLVTVVPIASEVQIGQEQSAAIHPRQVPPKCPRLTQCLRFSTRVLPPRTRDARVRLVRRPRMDRAIKTFGLLGLSLSRSGDNPPTEEMNRLHLF